MFPWSIISWWLSCGRWTVSEYFLVVSLTSSEREALTPMNIHHLSIHIWLVPSSPLAPPFFFYATDVWIVKIYSLICYNSVPGKKKNENLQTALWVLGWA